MTETVMASYSLKEIADATGLEITYIKRCLQKKPHMFKSVCHRDANNRVRFNQRGLALFQKISARIRDSRQPETSSEKESASSGENLKVDSAQPKTQSSKSIDIADYQDLMAKHQRLYKRLEAALREVESEKAKRLRAENDLRRFFSEIKPLTDNHSIEQAIILRQNRRLRRAEIIGQLENHRFFNTGARKKLFEELKALDQAYFYKLLDYEP